MATRLADLLPPFLAVVGLLVLLLLEFLGPKVLSSDVYFLLAAAALALIAWYVTKGSILFTVSFCALGLAFLSSLSVYAKIAYNPRWFVDNWMSWWHPEEIVGEVSLRGTVPTLGAVGMCMLALLMGGDRPIGSQFRQWPLFLSGIFVTCQSAFWFLDIMQTHSVSLSLIPDTKIRGFTPADLRVMFEHVFFLHQALPVLWLSVGIFLMVASLYAWRRTKRLEA